MLPSFGSPDRLLRRFRRTGDPRLLGRLFDLTAPELLRAALWLSGNRADADDLLQRTFLTVIEARTNYDPSRRALPWLLGVLGNHARKLHTRRERERERSPWFESAPGGEADPRAVAEHGELQELLMRLRRDLGAPYTEVLDLHLGQGLCAGEIAVQLGRPAGTVRTQLVRGLELMRRRLPPSLLAPMLAVAVLAPGAKAQGFEAIRRTLMRAAAAATPGAATATAAGKPLALAIAALLVATASGALLWLTRPAAAPTGSPTAAASSDTAAERNGEANGRDPAARTVAPMADHSGAAGERADDALAPGHGRARGLVVDAGGLPVPGAALWLSTAEDRGTSIAAGEADGDGRFDLDFAGTCYLGASARGQIASFVHSVHPGRVQDLELRLRGRSGLARGTVYDHRGLPLAGAQVEVGLIAGFRVSNTTREEMFYPPRRSARTAGDGTFALDVEPGTADVLARAPGHGLYHGSVTVEVGGATQLLIRLQAGTAVFGTVRDDRGEPVAGAVVRASGPDDLATTTDADGRYVLGDLAAGARSVAFEAAGARHEQAMTLAPGERRRCDARLAPVQLVRGVVVDATGRAMPRIGLAAGSFATGLVPLAVTGDDGAFAFPDQPIAHGDEGIELRLGDAPLVRLHPVISPGEHLVLTVDDAHLPSAHLVGRLVDEGGRPLHALLQVNHHGISGPFYGGTRPDGSFRIGPLAPGDYTVALETTGCGRLPMRVLGLAGGEERDLGTLHLQPARAVELELRGIGAGTRRLVQFARDDGIVIAHAMSEGDAVLAELPPGHYAASVVNGDAQGSSTRFEVAAEGTTRGVILCVPTARVAVLVTGLTAAPNGRRIELVVRDDTGAFVDSRELPPREKDAIEARLGLPPGSYAVECRTTDGLAATLPLTIRAPDDFPVLRFALR